MPTLHQSAKETKTQVNLQLSGDLGLNNAAEFRQALLDRSADARRLRVNLAKIDAIDLSTFQTLYALKRGRAARGLETVVEADLSQATAQLLAHANIEIFDNE